MTIPKFIAYLIAPLLQLLLLPFLLIAWMILGLVVWVWNVWYKATGDSRYEPNLY